MAAKNKNPSVSKALAELWLSLTGQLFDSYHPERHYMRGPGPKWRAKHDTMSGQAALGGAAKASA